MSDALAEINERLRAADVALAMSTGGTTELGHLRHAVGSLLVAVHALAVLSRPAPLPAGTSKPRPAAAAKKRRRRA